MNTSPSAMLSHDDIRMLTEIGFVASKRGWVAEAESIFRALIILRADRDFPYIGLALTLLAKGDAAAALEVFEKASPLIHTDPFEVIWALVLQQSNQRERSQRKLNELLARSPQSSMYKLAQAMLTAHQ